MDYIILRDEAAELGEVVIKKIAEGWEPLGGVAFAGQLERLDGLYVIIFAQAMIKKA